MKRARRHDDDEERGFFPFLELFVELRGECYARIQRTQTRVRLARTCRTCRDELLGAPGRAAWLPPAWRKTLRHSWRDKWRAELAIIDRYLRPAQLISAAIRWSFDVD